MRRPDFVVDEDVERWSENIDNDPNMPKVYADNLIMREIMYAGMWLAEQLEKEGCNKILIAQLQYTAGALCFGNPDVWQVMQDMLDAYKNNELEFNIDYDA